jgi:hypothetical protein
MLAWCVFLPITMLVPSLRDSVLWVAELSIWALVATHLGAWIAALVNVRAEDIQHVQESGVTLDHLNEHEEMIESILISRNRRFDVIDRRQDEMLTLLRELHDRL